LNFRDIAKSTTKIAIAPLVNDPVIAATINETVDLLFNVIPTGKKDDILTVISDRLAFLEKNHIDLKELEKDEVFQSVLYTSIPILMRAHQKEKLEAVFNSITNVPLTNIAENYRFIFLNLIDKYNEWHLRILKALGEPELYLDLPLEGNPLAYLESNFILLNEKNRVYTLRNFCLDITDVTRERFLLLLFPELRKDKVFFRIILNDLINDQLINEGLLKSVPTHHLIHPCTTEFGKSFIESIQDPNTIIDSIK